VGLLDIFYINLYKRRGFWKRRSV